MSYPVLKDNPETCMKCGFCMSGCPVYNIDKTESHVARGRNVLIQMSKDNCIDLDESYKSALYYCLLCGRCEAVCPAKVSSSAITLNARREFTEKKGLPFLQRLIFRGFIRHRSFLARLGKLISLIPGISQRQGEPIRHFPDIISAILHGISVPRFSVPFLTQRIKEIQHTKREESKGRLAFFSGCIFEFIFADTGMDMIKLLETAGYDVSHPDQTCCGLPAYASGDADTAKAMALRNIESLSGYDYIVTGCASCGSTLKSYVNWFDDEETKQKAYELSKKVKDLSEFLVQQDFKPELPAGSTVKVTYHDPCHLRWKQGINAEPREILKNIPGVEFIEMEGADDCCGLGGSFRLSHPDASVAIQSKKIESIRKTGADIVATSCPGCMIQLMDGLRRNDLPIKVMHIGQLIKDSQQNK
jgi:glycolate oxidase iron-sulfur subunit